MNTIRFAAALVLTLSLPLAATACGSSEPSKPGATAGATDKGAADGKGAAAPGGTAIEGLPLVVELPAGVVPNAMGAGFHSEDGSWSVSLRDIIGDTNPKDMDAAKKATEEMFFKKWNKTEKTADGWILDYVGVGLDMSGKEYENYAFSVRSKIGGREYDCYGGVKKQADVAKNIKLCQAIKAAP